jgi:6-phosphogluconolactonase (cycloisomerase 2 family)
MSTYSRIFSGALFALAAATAHAAECGTERLYIGTHQQGGASSIFTATFDVNTGVPAAARAVSTIDRPTWLVKDPARPMLYSVSETGNDGRSHGKVFSLRIDPLTGALEEAGSVQSGGGGPTHLALDERSNTMFVANYGTGQVAALAVQASGMLGESGSVVSDYGTGPTPRQLSPHAHGVTLDPSRKFVLVSDLGADRVFVYRFVAGERRLQPADAPFLQLPPGSGPRHLVFGPDGHYAYLLNELTADLNVYAWDAGSGTLTPLQTLSTLSAGYQGKKSAGEILVSADGTRLYLSNRGEDTIIAYAVDAGTGRLSELQRIASGGKQPWHLALSPEGRWLLAANEASNAVKVFAVDRSSGRLAATAGQLDVAAPVNIVFAGAVCPTLRAGAVRVDITPPDLTALNPMGGSFKAVHDPIYLRALVLDDGRRRVALVSLDLIEVGDTEAVRQRIARELGIASDHVLISPSHNHSAPRLGRVTPGALAHDGGSESDAYTAWVYDRMLAALRQAGEALQPARLGSGRGQVDVNVNRDAYSAARGWGLGYAADGPSDKTLRVVKVESADGAPLAVLLNYAVHSTVTLGANEISGDLAGAAERYVEEAIGRGVVVLWTPGALGDQAPRVSRPREVDAQQANAAAYRAMDAQGLLLGAEAVRVAAGIDQLQSSVRLAAAQRVVSCPAKVGRNVMATMKQQQVDSVPLRLSLIMIDRVALAGVSGEVLNAIGARLYAASPLTDTLLVSIANDRIGYLPPDAAYDLPLFEVNGSPVVRGCAENAIVDGLSQMISEHQLSR